MKSPWQKAAAICVGLVLLVICIAMLTSLSGIEQSSRNNAFAYVIGLLGLGMIATVFFRDSLKVSGDKLGPFGKVLATGGAAVFIVGLLFIWAIDDKPAPGEGNSAAQAAVAGEPAEEGPQEQTDETPPPTAVAASAEAEFIGDPYGSVSMITDGRPRVRTFCSSCCTNGPFGCPFRGGAVADTIEEAASMAIDMCITTGGENASCQNNAREF